MPRTRSRQVHTKPDLPPRPFPVATCSGFPGISIPLISEEERIARGIERPHFPPFETWTPRQQEAGRKLQSLMLDETVRQYCKLLLVVMESLDPTAFQDIRTLALAIADIARSRLEDGSWPTDDPLCFPSLLADLVRSLGRGELGLLDGPSTAD